MHLTSRRSFLTAAIAAAGCGRADSSRSQAARYLWSQQADDGGWHSHTYGLLRSGQSLTPFVLDALLDVSERPPGAVERAVEFIKRNTNADGSLGLMDSVAPDYPNYATGLALRAITRANAPGREPMIACLRAQQFTESNGWNRTGAPYGAWGMGGVLRRPPDPGHVDLAMTRYVLEGLAAAGVRPPDPALQSALVYLERCQNPDGGFFFSTVEAGINKAGEEAGKFRSYGSTTADGVLALRAAGIAETDARIVRAKQWLRQHHLYDRATGFDGGPRETWAAGLRFYYAAAISRALPELSVLLPAQHPDGSFVNSSNLVKEDDPLIATGFALRVLSKNN
jgi:hypothetical protein